MPYDNPTNRAIAKKVRQINQNHINKIESISETNKYDVATPLESMTMRKEQVTGGSGYVAATVQDLGFEPTIGITGSGMSSCSTDRQVGGGGLLTLSDMYKMEGQPEETMQKKVTKKASPHKDPKTPRVSRGSAINGPIGGSMPDDKPKSKAPSARNELVKKIMQEQKMSLPQASKYIK